MLNRSDLGSHLSQVATPKTESSTSGLVLGGMTPMTLTAPRSGIVASSRAWIRGTACGDDVVVELLPLLVHHDEIGHEHPRLSGPVRDFVVEVVNLPTPLARNLDGLDSEGLEREVEDPDAFLVSRHSAPVHELHVEHIAVMRNRNRSQVRNERNFWDLRRAGQRRGGLLSEARRCREGRQQAPATIQPRPQWRCLENAHLNEKWTRNRLPRETVSYRLRRPVECLGMASRCEWPGDSFRSSRKTVVASMRISRFLEM